MTGEGVEPSRPPQSTVPLGLTAETAVPKTGPPADEALRDTGNARTLRNRIADGAKRWYPVFVIIEVLATFIIVPLVVVPLVGIYHRLAHPKIILSPLSALQLSYQPRSQEILAIDFGFTATNTGDSDGSLQDPYAMLEDASAPTERLIPFGPSDIKCKVQDRPVELAYVPVPKMSTVQVVCSASNVLGPISKGALAQPGRRYLRINMTGDEREYHVNFCLQLMPDFTEQLKAGKPIKVNFLKTTCD
jgi:hypothetical protein